MYIEEITNKIIDKFNNAKTIEELNDLYDNELSNLPIELQYDFILAELTENFAQNTERLINNNEQRNGNEENKRNTKSTSGSDFGTVQTSNGGFNQRSANETQGQTQNSQINPDELYQTDVNENFKKWSDNAPLVTSETVGQALPDIKKNRFKCF